MADNALAQNPLEMEMWRAGDLRRQGKWLHAVQCYRSILEANPDHVPAYLDLAHIFLDHHQWRAAQDLLHRGLIANPGDTMLSLHLGNAYLGEGDVDRAVRHYRLAVKADAHNAAAAYNLGLALARLGRNAEAIVALTPLVEARPDYPGLAELLGNTFLTIGRADRALAILIPAEARTPERPRLLYLLALAFSEQKRWIEAEIRLRKAHALSPDDGEIMRSCGWVLLRQGNAAEATEWLQRAIAVDPSLVYAYVDLAAALRATGRSDEAASALATARALDPDNPWISDSSGERGDSAAPRDVKPAEERNGTHRTHRGDAIR